MGLIALSNTVNAIELNHSSQTKLGKYAPDKEQVLMFVGQDNQSVGGNGAWRDGYIEQIGTPAGITHYVYFSEGKTNNFGASFDVGSVDGLNKETSWGSGPMCLRCYLESETFDGTVVHLSISMELDDEAEVANGNYDHNIDELVAFLKEFSEVPFIIRIGYEFDGEWNNYEAVPFKAAWHRIVDTLRRENVNNFSTMLASFSVNTPRKTWDEYWPGDDYVDWLGYSYWGDDKGQGDSLALAREKQLPVFIAELAPKGFDLSRQKDKQVWQDWFVPFFKHIDDNRDVIRAVSYINANWEAQKMWQGAKWGDTRLQANSYIKAQWLQKMSDSNLVHSPEGVYAAIGFKPAPLGLKTATFNWFEYQGLDTIFEAPLKKGEYQNPILAGFHPDPSVCRVGDDYYLVNSSFSYTPGLPIYHSKDLVNWQFLTYAFESQSDLNFRKQVGMSRGIFAPTIREHNGVFYIVSTAIDAGENFIITATNPAGPWSDPVWLPELNGGIDPDIFFDDGKTYISHNGPAPAEPLYDGHRALYMWEYDHQKQAVVASSKRLLVDGGADISTKPIWIEGPHLYKIGNWYYLSAAEGGTADDHSQVIFRSKTLAGEFTPFSGNPILTQRDLSKDRINPINATGHADMVQTPNGEWWTVFLGTRNYDKIHFNTGRETFLLPVQWQDEWPVILPQGKTVPLRSKAPVHNVSSVSLDNIEPFTGNVNWRDGFDGTDLNHHWNFLRSSTFHDWYSLSANESAITLMSLPISLHDFGQAAFIGRRQQNTHYLASTEFELPSSSVNSMGIAAFQNEAYHYYFGVKKDSLGYLLFVEEVAGDEPKIIVSKRLKTSLDTMVMLVEINASKLSFSYRSGDGDSIMLIDNIDAVNLSTSRAQGFIGSYVGLHSRLESQIDQ